ncbi:hypothetical protein [Paenibacillus pedocola]|uniref:hypothetical protein n=1 Tax=Paenibacillus pedocola TaxID=3242193 RepID=UPI0028774DF2|nr:hypothetical protein [Paenibacillus typhae]
MAILSTGPVENNPVSGVRPTQSVTVRIVNLSSVSTAGLLIEGHYLNTLRNLYVSEVLSVAPNEALSRDYFADLDAFEFMFTTNGNVETELGISVWGKQADGQLAEVHRVVAHEKLA